MSQSSIHPWDHAPKDIVPKEVAAELAKPRPRRPLTWILDLLVLGLVFGSLLYFHLGVSALSNPDEGRYAEVPREMVASRDFVTPRLNGVLYFEKPPLVYWIVAACEARLGPGEGGVRGVPAAFALAGILLTYAAARGLYGRRAGACSAVVLGTCALFFGLGRLLLLDMAVAVLMSATLFCFILAVDRPPGSARRTLFLLLYGSAALAVLAKGLMGILVSGAVMLLWLLLTNQWRRLQPMHLPEGLVLFLAIAVPWHVVVAARNPGWAHFYFVHEHWERFTSRVHGRYQPWWYFIPILLGGLFPWTGFLFAAFVDALGVHRVRELGVPRGAVQRLWKAGRSVVLGLAEGWRDRGDNAAGWFMAVWAAFIFLFFSYSQSKLAPYILPVFPPVAVMIGVFVARALWGFSQPGYPGGNRLRFGLHVFTAISAVLAIAVLVVVADPGLLIRDPIQAVVLRPFAGIVALILLAGTFAVPPLTRTRGPRFGLVCLVATALPFMLTLAWAQPDIQAAIKPGTRDLALEYKALAAPGDKVYHYHGFFHDFTYYAGTPVGLVSYQDELELDNDPAARASGRFIDDAELLKEWGGPGRVWIVARKNDDERGLERSLKARNGIPFVVRGQTSAFVLLSNRP